MRILIQFILLNVSICMIQQQPAWSQSYVDTFEGVYMAEDNSVGVVLKKNNATYTGYFVTSSTQIKIAGTEEEEGVLTIRSNDKTSLVCYASVDMFSNIFIVDDVLTTLYLLKTDANPTEVMKNLESNTPGATAPQESKQQHYSTKPSGVISENDRGDADLKLWYERLVGKSHQYYSSGGGGGYYSTISIYIKLCPSGTGYYSSGGSGSGGTDTYVSVVDTNNFGFYWELKKNDGGTCILVLHGYEGQERDYELSFEDEYKYFSGRKYLSKSIDCD